MCSISWALSIPCDPKEKKKEKKKKRKKKVENNAEFLHLNISSRIADSKRPRLTNGRT
jgi:hypothetical protein